MGLIVHRSYINGFSKKKSFRGQMGYLGPTMSHPASQLWIRCKDCFTILHNRRNFIQSNLVIFEQKLDGVLLALNLLSGFFINFTQ